MLDWNPQPPYTAEQLLQVIRILRDPENGCPWDKVQTHASIRKNFLEETCEALEAIDADDAVLLREELGDVLMQVVFHAAMEEERGRFTFEDVCRNVCEKLVFRHPNIFASSAAENAHERLATLAMRGNETFRHAVTRMKASAASVIERAGLTADDIQLIIPHQANLRIINAVAQRLSIPEDKVFVNIEKYGNTSAAAVAIAFDEARASPAI